MVIVSSAPQLRKVTPDQVDAGAAHVERHARRRSSARTVGDAARADLVAADDRSQAVGGEVEPFHARDLDAVPEVDRADQEKGKLIDAADILRAALDSGPGRSGRIE